MELNLPAMLQTAIQVENKRWYDHAYAMQPEERLRRAYVVAQTAMSQLIDLTGQTALAHQNAADSKSVLTAYVAVVDAFFQIAARQSWSQLIVMTPDEQVAITQKRPAKSLNQQALAVQQFLLHSYFDRQQAAFKHAWHLVLKWGLVDLAVDAKLLEAAFLKTDR